MGRSPLSNVQAIINLPRGDLIALVGGILLGETLLFAGALQDPGLVRAALFVHLLTFVGCLLAPVGRDDVASPGTYFVLSLLPMTRLAFTGLPTLSEITVLQLALSYAVVVPAVLLVTAMDSTPDPELGWRAVKVVGPFFLPLAVVLGLGEFLALRPTGVVPGDEPAWMFLGATLFVFVVGPVEELLFRGLLQEALEVEVGPGVAILVAGGLYGVAHAQYGSLPTVAFATLTGLFFGFLYARTGSLGLVAMLNGVMSFCTFVALPLWF